MQKCIKKFEVKFANHKLNKIKLIKKFPKIEAIVDKLNLLEARRKAKK